MPRGRAVDATPEPLESAASPTPAMWESVLDDEPASLNASRGAESPAYDEFDLPPPPREAYLPPPSQSRSYRHRGNNLNAGVTVAGCYAAFAFVVGVGFFFWMVAAQPPNARIGQAFAITVFCLHVMALLVHLGGTIWILAIAFGESMGQGLLCLFVPCYSLYYVVTRWEDTSGPFSMQLVPFASLFVFFALGAAIDIAGKSDAVKHLNDDSSKPPNAVPAAGDAPLGFGPRSLSYTLRMTCTPLPAQNGLGFFLDGSQLAEQRTGKPILVRGVGF